MLGALDTYRRTSMEPRNNQGLISSCSLRAQERGRPEKENLP